jgi:DNA-binding MarR family transcriptional regulator
VLNAFIDFTLRSLGRNEAAVWLVLYRDTKGGTARTSIADMARRSGASTRTVKRVVASLERRGLLRVVHRGGLGRGVSIYRVLPLAPTTAR